MKSRYKIIIFSFLIIIMLIGYLSEVDFYNEDSNFVKPKSIPESAVWRGGTDGGYWFEFLGYDITEGIYHIKIYDERTGELIVNGKFKVSDKCRGISVNDTLLQSINYYANDEIVLNTCSLYLVEKN